MAKRKPKQIKDQSEQFIERSKMDLDHLAAVGIFGPLPPEYLATVAPWVPLETPEG